MLRTVYEREIQTGYCFNFELLKVAASGLDTLLWMLILVMMAEVSGKLSATDSGMTEIHNFLRVLFKG